MRIPFRLLKIASFLLMLCITVAVSSISVHAQGNLNNAAQHLNDAASIAGTSDGEIGSIIGLVIKTVLTLVGLIFLILMVYAGYLWMTARGESDQVDKARQMITSAIIGLVIVSSGYAITVFFTNGFSK